MLIDFSVLPHYFLLSTVLPSLIKENFLLLYSLDRVKLCTLGFVRLHFGVVTRCRQIWIFTFCRETFVFAYFVVCFFLRSFVYNDGSRQRCDEAWQYVNS